MINSILTNTTALAVRNNLNNSNNSLAKSIERLSSGFKINCAKDGAVECAISTKNNIQLAGLNIANENAMQGINMLNTAESAIENMSEKTMRIRDLVLKTLNSTYSNDELDAIQNEINQLIEEIEREKETTVYNKKKIFDTTIEKTQEVKPAEKPYLHEVEYIESTGTQWINTDYIPSGNFSVEAVMQATPGQGNRNLFGASGGSSGEPTDKFYAFNIYDDNRLEYKTYASPDANWQIVEFPEMCDKNKYEMSSSGIFINDQKLVDFPGGECNVTNPVMVFKRSTSGGAAGLGKVYSFKIKDSAGELVRDMIPVVDNEGKAGLYDKISKQIFYNQGSGDFEVGEKIEEPKEYEKVKISNATTLQIGQEAGENSSIKLDLGFNLNSFEIDIKKANGAKEAIEKCDELIKMFSLKRCEVGSSISRINSICDLQNKEIESLSQVKSLITDTDIAAETTKFTQAQIMKDISNSLLIHANQITNSLALKLLKIQSYPM